MTETNAVFIIQIFVAVAILMLGRRLFWIFVAGIGFVAGMSIAGDFVQPDREWVTLAIAVAVGLVGALLAVFVQKLAIVVAGFLAAAFLVQSIAADLGLIGDSLNLAMIVGGVVGAIVASILFDWALIVLSSLAGAALLVDALEMDPLLSLVAMMVLATAGIAVQARMLQHDKKAGE